MFSKGTKANPLPDRAARDGYYEHLLDALGYAIVNVSDYRGPFVPEPERAAPLPQRRGFDERPKDPVPDAHALDIKETRRSVWSPFRKRY